MTIDTFKQQIKENGWVCIEGVVPHDLITELNFALDSAYNTCRRIQLENGVAVNTDGTVHHLIGQDDAFLKVLNAGHGLDYVSAYFEAPFIINSFGGVINMRNKASYVCNIHRDIRTHYNMPMMINMLIMLDDFTLENGATYLLSKSHLIEDKPTDENFFLQAERAIGSKGSILLFDSYLWHAAGINQTDEIRRALTVTFSRPFMKQQMDYPRAIGYDKVDGFSDSLKQVLGYNARVPASLHEWYQPKEKRFYKANQE